MTALPLVASNHCNASAQLGVAGAREAIDRILGVRGCHDAYLICRECGVDGKDFSRIPVRDALRILETRGLVSLKANAGARVTSLTVRDMDVSYKIRESLEPMLLAESLPHLTAEDIEAMREVKQRLDAVTDLDEYLPLSREFHWISFRRHQTPLLAQIVERLWDTTHSYRRAYAHLAFRDAERLQLMRAERDLLFGAIERREFDLAPRILGMHIRRTHMTLLEYTHQHDLLTHDPADRD